MKAKILGYTILFFLICYLLYKAVWYLMQVWWVLIILAVLMLAVILIYRIIRNRDLY